MPDRGKIRFIVNPRSGGGKSDPQLQALAAQIRQFFPEAAITETRGRRHAAELSAAAVHEGCELVVAVGGDGTISEVASGFFDSGGRPLTDTAKLPALGILPAGSGSDYAKTLDIPRAVPDALGILQQRKTRPMDAGLLEFTNDSGLLEKRIFINIADVGIGGEVVDILEKQGKWLGPFLSYQLATVRGLIAYENKRLSITLDEQQKFEGTYNGAVVAIGRYFGSGMKIAPNALPDDGLFDVVLLGEMSKLEMIAKMQKVRSGAHIHEKNITVHRARHVRIEAEGRALIDCDGEMPGACPAEFTILPGALRVVAPAP